MFFGGPWERPGRRGARRTSTVWHISGAWAASNTKLNLCNEALFALATQDLLIRVAMHMHATAVTRQAHELLNTRLWSVPHKVLDDI